MVTPSEISNKYMWYPPVPERVGLSQILQDADIFMDEDSVTFFFKLCCGHRGIFMHAMDWVQARQQGSKEKWDVVRSISEVRSTFGGRKNREIRAWKQGLLQHFTQSRAVRVNGKFSDVNLIPKEFAEVLFGGPKLQSELQGQERELTISGFLVPQRQGMGDEFVLYDWNDPTVCYEPSNAILADYYGTFLPTLVGYKSELIDSLKIPTSATDLLGRVLPFNVIFCCD